MPKSDMTTVHSIHDPRPDNVKATEFGHMPDRYAIDFRDDTFKHGLTIYGERDELVAVAAKILTELVGKDTVIVRRGDVMPISITSAERLAEPAERFKTSFEIRSGSGAEVYENGTWRPAEPGEVAEPETALDLIAQREARGEPAASEPQNALVMAMATLEQSVGEAKAARVRHPRNLEQVAQDYAAEIEAEREDYVDGLTRRPIDMEPRIEVATCVAGPSDPMEGVRSIGRDVAWQGPSGTFSFPEGTEIGDNVEVHQKYGPTLVVKLTDLGPGGIRGMIVQVLDQ